MNNTEIKKSLNCFIEQYFQEIENLPSSNIAKIADSTQLEKIKNINIPNEGRKIQEVINEMIEDVYDYRAKLDHPRFFGFVPGPADITSWIGDVMTSAYNLHTASWMLSSGASCIEKNLIDWLSKKVGYDTTKSVGLFVSGGSMANLTALVTARDNKLSPETFHLGVAYVSDQTHSSIKKALKISGISPQNIRKISSDSNYKMNINELERTIQTDILKGLKPFVIIASAGTTNTASIDPMYKISNVCSKYKLWMHVDGAYGASILLSKNYNNLLEGIENADSLSWDAHKWLFQTYACGMVIVKDKNNSAKSFSENPEYLRDLDVDNGQVNYGNIGMELTRPARFLKLWTTLQTLGTDEISRRIEYSINLAEYVKELLEGLDNWEIISKPSLAIINFRYAPCGISQKEKDDINNGISNLMLQSNYAGIFTTILNNKVVLRMCCINHETTKEDIKNTITKLDTFAKKLLEDMVTLAV